MESINIKVDNGKKRFCLNDDENKIIEFNVEDIKTRKKFYDASEKVFKSQREFDIEYKKIVEDEKMEEAEKVEKLFELEEATFNAMKEIIDDIFGAGVTDMITDGEVNTYAMGNFLIAIAPYFKEVADKQMNKYTDNLKSAGII